MRVVSLVPSATETLLDLGVRPVACTRFCEQAGIPTVGGTKDPDLAAILERRPDLVVVNDEENRREDAEALRVAGLALHDCSPRAVTEVGPAVGALADALGVETPAPFGGDAWAAWLAGLDVPGPPRRAVTLVWRRPWMALGEDTYGASVLAWLGLVTRTGAGAPARYPVVELDQLRAAAPALVLLPSEPYPFRARHVDELARALPGVEARLVDGRDLFWWGTRTPHALGRLRAALS